MVFSLSLSLWQAALKLLAGDDEELLRIIPILLGCKKEDITDGIFIEENIVQDVVVLMKDTAFSHLMEVSSLLIWFALNISHAKILYATLSYFCFSIDC